MPHRWTEAPALSKTMTKPMTPLTEEQKRYALSSAKIVGMKRYTVIEIVRELDGVQHVEVIRSDQAMAFNDRGNPKKFSVENELSMVKEYEDGKNLEQVGATWGCTRSTAMAVMHKHGVTMRRGKARANGDDRHPDHRTLTALEDYK